MNKKLITNWEKYLIGFIASWYVYIALISIEPNLDYERIIISMLIVHWDTILCVLDRLFSISRRKITLIFCWINIIIDVFFDLSIYYEGTSVDKSLLFIANFTIMPFILLISWGIITMLNNIDYNKTKRN